jgi:hypothetical protein
MGQVLESYINFGTPGVVTGFLIVGIVLTLIDRSARWHLQRGDASRFLLWYLPGLSLLQGGGSLVEIAATAAAALALAFIVRHLVAMISDRSRVPVPVHSSAEAPF